MISEVFGIVTSLSKKIMSKTAKRLYTLSIIKSSDDYASNVYIKAKVNKGKELGLNVVVHDVSKDPDSIRNTLSYTCKLSDGVIVQLPLHDDLKDSKYELLDMIPANKDVDGLGAEAIVNLYRTGKTDLPPCTAAGIMQIIDKKFPRGIAGKHAVIVNRSELIGKPLMHMLLAKDATVTVCHSKTVLLGNHVRRADIVVTAAGVPNLINECMFDHRCFIVDAGISRGSDGKLCGDCSKSLYSFSFLEVTPVPGGVGPLTVLNLMNNTVNAGDTYADS